MKRTGKKTSKVIKSFVAVVLAAFFCLSAAADSSYIVKKGDTLYSLSRRYQLTVGELRTANNLSENDKVIRPVC